MVFTEDNLIPYFQPIISIDNNSIYGYEILGRYINKGREVKSLGDFFTDPSVDSQSALEVDRIIREKGIEEFALHGGENQYIFINMRLSWLNSYAKNPQDMPTIKWADQYGINYKNIVIELTEEDVNNCSDYYMTALSYYRSLGIKIAIDDYGCKNSNIHRLAEFSPDIIKVDMSFVHKSEEFFQYRHYLKLLTEFADSIGIEVIYEGVENSQQLINCINSQGRFYQGFFLSKPLPTIKDSSFEKEQFKRCAYSSIILKQSSIEKNKNLQSKMDSLVNNCLEEKPFDQNSVEFDEYLSDLCNEIPQFVLRLYICNRYGFQVSSNFELGDGTITVVDYTNRNWAWRGYFLNALKAINDNKSSYLTETYRDVSSKEKILTYARKLSRDIFLFVDIAKSEVE